MIGKPYTITLLIASLFVLFPLAAHPQAAGSDGWNDTAVLELVRRGMERRSTEVRDTALRTYAAKGNGYVYFILDAPEADRQALVRTDQVAVEVYWRSPNEVRQRIVGLREQRELPITRLYYYLDRLTVVQDNYGQSIVIADGDNVNDVPHPIGAGADGFYNYRLGDSLTLRLTGLPDPVRVQQVHVRPKDTSRPAVVGSVFLEVATGALVRMSFTFTPSAYIDPRLDFINVTLENGLWRGRYWLPHEQRLEIRRELPELDLPFGTVIRTRMRVGDYRFNEGVPEWLFASRFPITMAPREQREQYAFERPIDAEWQLEGVRRPVDVQEIRTEAQAILRERAMTGLPRSRLAIGSASDLFRYNRAEGVAVGVGWGTRPTAGLTLRLRGGWAFGASQPVSGLDLTGGREQLRLSLTGYVNKRLDVGGTAPASGAANTLGALLFATDWSDPYYATGAEWAAHWRPGGAWLVRGSARLERQRSATLSSTFALFESADSFRPVREIDRGTHGSLSLAVRRDEQRGATGRWVEGRITAGRLTGERESFSFIQPEVHAGVALSRTEHRVRIDLAGRAGLSFGEIPRQELYLLGGRGTLPGYEHRAFPGDRFALVSAIGSADLSRPWLRGRLFAAAGWTGIDSAGERAAALWTGSGNTGVHTSIGAGLGLFYDLLHVDVARGLGRGGRTQLIIEFQPAFWDFL